MRSNKKLINLSLLCSMALIIYIIELQIPIPIPIPGVKLGLANMISLCVLILYDIPSAFLVLLLRIFLGNMLTGQLASLSFSLVGGLLSLVSMSLLWHFFKETIHIPLLSIIGSVLHNLGQILVAYLLVGSLGVVVYLPLLLVIGILSGYLTGLISFFVITHLKKLIPSNTKSKDID